MAEKTTDGKTITSPDMCPYCSLTTAGDHQPDCPLYQSQFVYLTNEAPPPIDEINIAIYGPSVGMNPSYKLYERTPHTCPVCEGRGFIPDGFYLGIGHGHSTDTEPCRSCNGTGIVWG